MSGTPPTTPPRASAEAPRPTPDAYAILSRARRILWRLRADKANRIDPAAAAAVTTGRHGDTGRRFAAGIIGTVGPDAGDAELDGAIARALQEVETGNPGRATGQRKTRT